MIGWGLVVLLYAFDSTLRVGYESGTNMRIDVYRICLVCAFTTNVCEIWKVFWAVCVVFEVHISDLIFVVMSFQFVFLPAERVFMVC